MTICILVEGGYNKIEQGREDVLTGFNICVGEFGLELGGLVEYGMGGCGCI